MKILKLKQNWWPIKCNEICKYSTEGIIMGIYLPQKVIFLNQLLRSFPHLTYNLKYLEFAIGSFPYRKIYPEDI